MTSPRQDSSWRKQKYSGAYTGRATTTVGDQRRRDSSLPSRPKELTSSSTTNTTTSTPSARSVAASAFIRFDYFAASTPFAIVDSTHSGARPLRILHNRLRPLHRLRPLRRPLPARRRVTTSIVSAARPAFTSAPTHPIKS
jgi:hypothetical protein